jgi:hypothetical protein
LNRLFYCLLTLVYRVVHFIHIFDVGQAHLVLARFT